MKFSKIILVVMCTFFLIGCSNDTNKDKSIESEINIDNNVETDNLEKSEVDKSESKKTMENIIIHKNDIKFEENSTNSNKLEVANKLIEEYIRGINLVKEFCENNLLELTYEEPIEHRISRFKEGKADEPIITHLENLYVAGAESVSYFTNEPELNVELGTENNYSGVEYKASLANIDGDFNFKESKLNEFRTSIVNSAEIDFDKLNEFIKSVYNNEMTIDMRFFNKIDENSYEIIRVERNNCYYKFVYDPYYITAIE